MQDYSIIKVWCYETKGRDLNGRVCLGIKFVPNTWLNRLKFPKGYKSNIIYALRNAFVPLEKE